MPKNDHLKGFECLGVKIDGLSPKNLVVAVNKALDGGGCISIATPNPEMIVKAQTDPYFKQILNSFLTICDGYGLYLALRLKGAMLSRLTGVDAMMEILKIACYKRAPVYLLGSNSQTVILKTVERLKVLIPGLIIAGYNKGGLVTELETGQISVDENENQIILNDIEKSGAQVLIVAFGMGKQEKWIQKYGQKIAQLKVMIGVGGSFDYVSQVVPRAPLLMRKIGLEWLYRLIKQPARAKRIWNATAKFIFLVCQSAWKKN